MFVFVVFPFPAHLVLRKGDKVIMTGWEMGQKFHGGHAEYASVKVQGPWHGGDRCVLLT